MLDTNRGDTADFFACLPCHPCMYAGLSELPINLVIAIWFEQVGHCATASLTTAAFPLNSSPRKISTALSHVRKLVGSRRTRLHLDPNQTRRSRRSQVLRGLSGRPAAHFFGWTSGHENWEVPQVTSHLDPSPKAFQPVPLFSEHSGGKSPFLCDINMGLPS